MVASGGIERSVLLWQPKGNMNQRVGELSGHSAAVCRVEVAEENNQVLTLTEDGVVRLFDLRTHKCIQTLAKQGGQQEGGREGSGRGAGGQWQHIPIAVRAEDFKQHTTRTREAKREEIPERK